MYLKGVKGFPSMNTFSSYSHVFDLLNNASAEGYGCFNVGCILFAIAQPLVSICLTTQCLVTIRRVAKLQCYLLPSGFQWSMKHPIMIHTNKLTALTNVLCKVSKLKWRYSTLYCWVLQWNPWFFFSVDFSQWGTWWCARSVSKNGLLIFGGKFTSTAGSFPLKYKV